MLNKIQCTRSNTPVKMKIKMYRGILFQLQNRRSVNALIRKKLGKELSINH